MSLNSSVKSIADLTKDYQCTPVNTIRVRMEALKYRDFEKKYQDFISYWGSSILGAQVHSVKLDNKIANFVFGKKAGELINENARA